jgi:carbamoyltransferase
MNILGLNYGGHDTSACITVKGKVVAACEQERYDYVKHSRNFPMEAIIDCLKIAKLKMNEIDLVSFSNDPYLQIREKYIKLATNDNDRVDFLINDFERIKKLSETENFLREKLNFKKKIDFNEHHLCHLASTFYPSGFNNSLIVSYDGIGEIHSAHFAVGKKNKIKIIHQENKYPDSLGLIYTAITFYLGWNIFCDEGIIMGLAPYGNSKLKLKNSNKRYIDLFREIIKIDKKDPLKYIINKDWIDYYRVKDKWVSDKFNKIFGKKRKPGSRITQHHKNIAAALQDRLEEVVLYQLKILKKKTNSNFLCISGGVGLNCSLNGKIEKSKIFKKIFVQPASGDAGVAYGSCLYSHSRHYKNHTFKKDHNFYLGSRVSNKEIKKVLIKKKINFKDFKSNIFSETAKLIAKGKIIGWFQGATEFGPRALGNRSILCKPFPEEMRDHINKNVKFREYFRPFAPAVLEENLYDYFSIDQSSPHMLIACKVKKNKKQSIPAVVHVDESCRAQSVSKQSNLKFWKLINEFKKISGIPVLLNTSFNIKGQPIVNNPMDAIDCFKRYKIDYLIMDTFLIEKK